MSIHQRAELARDRARTAGALATGSGHHRRLRAAMTRDVAALLGVSPEHVLVTDDPARSYSGTPGQLITVHDPDDPTVVLRFIPEPGNTGIGGGAYLLLAACPGCSRGSHPTGANARTGVAGRDRVGRRPLDESSDPARLIRRAPHRHAGRPRA